MVPFPVVIAGDTLVAVGFYFIFLVYRENTFTSATIEVAGDQKVISTGPYAVVRHPMYASASLYLVGTPLALGSYWGLLPFVGMVPFLIWRLFDEETFLAQNLTGYPNIRKRSDTAWSRGSGKVALVLSGDHRRLKLFCRSQSASAPSEMLPSASAKISATTSASVVSSS